MAYRGVQSKCFFVEKDDNTFHALEQNVEAIVNRYIAKPRFTNPNDVRRNTFFRPQKRDSSQYTIEVPDDRHNAIFVNCDPNTVHNMPLVGPLAESMTPYTTFTATLGCNVEGLKRLEREKREGWFEYVNALTARMPRWHDSVLVSVVKDAAQWAYLSRLPEKWSDDSAESSIRVGSKMFQHGVEVASYRNSRDQFESMLKVLFLTNKERSLG